MTLRFEVFAYDHQDAEVALPVILPIYAEAYSEYPYLERDADVADFAAKYIRYVKQPGFQLALAKDGSDQPIGFALGYPLRPDTKWWDDLLEPIPTEITREKSGRTFAIIELAVKANYRRHGVARALHQRLLSNRREERVTLASRPEATAAQAAYRRWGYHIVGSLQPTPEAPIYLALLRTLPLNGPS